MCAGGNGSCDWVKDEFDAMKSFESRSGKNSDQQFVFLFSRDTNNSLKFKLVDVVTTETSMSILSSWENEGWKKCFNLWLDE